MSHFAVLVIGEDYEKQLAPYHEFECTGEDNEYVREIDKTEEYREKYLKGTVARLKLPDGQLVEFFDEKGEWKPEYSQPDTGSALFPRKTYFVPEGHEQVEVPAKDVQSFADWVSGWAGLDIIEHGGTVDLEDKHKYGYTLLNEQGEVQVCIDRTNPDKKWDWYQVGGRWTGFFKLKAGAQGLTGEPGLMTKAAKDGYADQAVKSVIDFAGMQKEAADEAAERYDKLDAVIAGRRWKTWKGFLEYVDKKDMSIEEARDSYHDQSVVKDVSAWEREQKMWVELDMYDCTREEFIESAARKSIMTFAVVKDGKWYQRGEMGWWGVVRDEKEYDAWEEEFTKLIGSLPRDTLLTVVDCHI
jgi:hypothetical protein